MNYDQSSSFSQARYKDFEMPGVHGTTHGIRGTYLLRAQTTPDLQTHRGLNENSVEMDRRPGVIVGESKRSLTIMT